MRSAERVLPTVALIVVVLSTSPRSHALSAVHQQRYAMGTMFDIVAYHPSRAHAEHAVSSAMDEILRLEQVMSHYRADSDLTKLNRRAPSEPVTIEPSLHEVIRTSLDVSRRSGGKFDVTMTPLLRLWSNARMDDRSPSAAEVEEARRCVGYENIEITAPNSIRFRSDCIEISLGGIGKGYAVERALAVLKAAGIRDALVNGGASSMAAVGAAPDRAGWPVLIGRRVLLLQGSSLSTSQQDFTGAAEGIVDPVTGLPAESTLAVHVIAPSATVADALSTTLVMLSIDEGRQLLARFADVAAFWISPAGEVHAAYRDAQLRVSDTH